MHSTTTTKPEQLYIEGVMTKDVRKDVWQEGVWCVATSTTTTAVVATAQHHLTVSAFKVLNCCAHRALLVVFFDDVDKKMTNQANSTFLAKSEIPHNIFVTHITLLNLPVNYI